MTDAAAPRTAVRALETPTYVDWPAIFAGAFIASAIAVLFTAFGSALGLTLASPYEGPTPHLFYPLVALWVLWITVSSFAAGGYVAGRLRRRIDDASPHEAHIRDAAHGLIVWAVAVVFAALVAAGSLTFAFRGAESGKSGVAKLAQSADPVGYAVDRFLRGEGKANAVAEEDRQQVMRIAAMSLAKRDIAADDRAYLSRLVAARAGLSPADADKRVDALAAELKSDADKARRAGVMSTYLATAALVLGAAAAWWGTSVGGRHRDEKFDASHLVRW